MNKNITVIYTIIVALSGGVDSSVSIWILKQLGYKIKCVFIKCWQEKKNIKNKTCNYKKDYKDCKNVCKLFNVKLYLIDFTYEYWNMVFSKFIKKLKKNILINPDILCNKIIKFNLFIKFSIKILKADFIATGHYAIKYKKKNSYFLLKGIDNKKDQTYFLYTLNQKQLKKCIFPIGNYYKKKIRDIAKNLNLINYKKKDSYGICFIGKKNFFKFIKKYIKEKPGIIINSKKEFLGIHKGLHFYTIGQRKNLNLDIKQKKAYYVIKKKIKKNKLIVSSKKKKLLYKGLYIKKIHFINKIKKIKKLKCYIKIRSQQYKNISCLIFFLKKIKIIFKKPILSICPGQSAVFYKKKICIGGGIITNGIILN